MNKMSRTVDKYTDKKELKLIFPFFISTFAEFICLWPYLPVDTVRTRIQVQLLKRRWIIRTTSTIRFTEGSRKFMQKKGFGDCINQLKYTSLAKLCILPFNFRYSKWSDILQGPVNYGLFSIQLRRLQSQQLF